MKAIEHKMGNIIVLLFKATVISTSSVVSISSDHIKKTERKQD